MPIILPWRPDPRGVEPGDTDGHPQTSRAPLPLHLLRSDPRRALVRARLLRPTRRCQGAGRAPLPLRDLPPEHGFEARLDGGVMTTNHKPATALPNLLAGLSEKDMSLDRKN